MGTQSFDEIIEGGKLQIEGKMVNKDKGGKKLNFCPFSTNRLAFCSPSNLPNPNLPFFYPSSSYNNSNKNYFIYATFLRPDPPPLLLCLVSCPMNCSWYCVLASCDLATTQLGKSGTLRWILVCLCLYLTPFLCVMGLGKT